MSRPCIIHQWGEPYGHPHIIDIELRRCVVCGAQSWRQLPPFIPSEPPLQRFIDLDELYRDEQEGDHER